MKRRTVLVVVLVLIAAFVVGNGGAGSSAPNPHRNKALSYALRSEMGGKIQFLPNGAPVPSLSGGVVVSATEILNESGTMNSVSPQSASSLSPGFTRSSSGCANSYSGSGAPTNVRANQDCGLRRQAEEQVAVNPADAGNIVVGQNDSRVGFNQTGVDWSIDGGRRWGDYSVPTRFQNCAGLGYDAASDPSMAFDAAGNMYYTAVLFDVNDPVSGLMVWKSDANNKGSFLHNPASELSAGPAIVSENCADFNLSPDKELIAADAFPSSPFAGNVYLTWTLFDFSCGGFCASAINFSRSTDGGNTWSPPVEISGNNPAICSFGDAFDPNRDPGDCNFDQGSVPVVGPDGSVNVAFNNCNTTIDAAQGIPAVCQQLFVRSTDGGLTWSDPVNVGLDYATQPLNLGDPGMTAAGCPVFRQCLLPNGYRMNDFPAMGVDEQSGKLAVFWSDFRNGGPCAEDTSLGLVVFTEPCANHNQDVFAAVSTDGGATWGSTKQVTTGTAAQWQAWGDVGADGTLYAGYYDRDNNGCEASGCNDITLARSRNDGATWTTRLITTGPMPNLTPANNPFQAGFLGDYMWVSAVGSFVYVVWADTRGVGGSSNPVPEEDVYIAHVRQLGFEGGNSRP
jgi:hypothetical protein